LKTLPLLLLLTPLVAVALEDAPTDSAAGRCDAPAYRQFDFWIGDWDVTSGEQTAGTNSIHPVHGGCALQENWQGAGPGGISGSSFNIYDRASSKWHQTWVDAEGTLLQLDGGLVDGAMVLSGSRPARTGGTALHRISWTPNADGSVRQLWEVSQDEGGTWNVLFDGLYVKSEEQP
jgi:hypothetical protein